MPAVPAGPKAYRRSKLLAFSFARAQMRPAEGAMFDSGDAILLARLQFAFTVSFHFLFPAFSIGLASYLMALEGL